MKHFILALWLLIFCGSLLSIIGLDSCTPPKPKTGRIDLELNPGVGIGVDASTLKSWMSGAATGIGANYTYTLSPRFQIRGGISEQFYTTSRKVEHPYPYVMDMNVRLRTVSTRLTAGGDWLLKPSPDGKLVYLGAALYADAIHSAKAYTKLFYISQETRDTLNVKDSYALPLPGIQLDLSLQGSVGRIGLRYWQDILSFTVPGVPMGRQRRSFVGIYGALNIYNFKR